MVLYKNFPTCAISKTSKKQDITDMHACDITHIIFN